MIRQALPIALAAAALCSCGRAQPPAAGAAAPVYNPKTGVLEELRSDKNGDGKVDTRAFMDGVRLRRIEIDRNHDGVPDRWEYYAEAGAGVGRAAAPLVERVEEAARPDGRISRREYYAQGLVERVEEDTDLDGRVDKWETYEGGGLVRVELDLEGAGRPTQRLIYGSGGAVVSLEVDPDGDGTFKPAQTPAAAPARGGKGR